MLVGSREQVGLEFGILGPLRVTVAGREQPLAGDKLRGLLAVLLVEPGRPVSADRLIDDLWGEEPPATARQSLYVHVARLRRALAVDGSDASPLETSPRGYVLHVADDGLDAIRFRRLLSEARKARRAGDARAAADGYRAALALWRGDALEDVALASLEPARAELDALRLDALEERIEIDLALGRAAELVSELEELVARHPLREGMRAQLMVALYATGRQADALNAYQDVRRDLDQLGLVPGPRLRDLEQAILRQDESLVTTPPPVAAPAARRGRRWRVGALVAAAAALAAVGLALVLDDDASAPARRGPAAVVVKPDSLVEIDPARNRVVSAVHVGRNPDNIVFTRDAAWVVATADRTVDRIDLQSREVRPLGGVPVALGSAATMSGEVWVSSFEEPYVTLVAQGGEAVGDGVISGAGPPRVRVHGSAEALAVGGGYLWVTSPKDSGGDNSVSRIDLRTRKLVSSTAVGNLPLYVAFGYGSAWVANYKGDSLSVVRPGSDTAETIGVSGGPLGVAAGAGGIWVVAFWDNELVRIDPETRRVLHRTRVGDGPLAVAVGGGSVWVTNRDSKTVSRIDPATNRVAATIHLAAAPYGIRFARGRVWVTTQRCGSPVKPC